MAAESQLAPPSRLTSLLKVAARKSRRSGRSAPARSGSECSEIPGGRGEEEVAAVRRRRAARRRRRAARSHGRAPLPGTLRAVAAAGAEPDPRGARCGRAEGHSPPPRELAAPGAAPSPPPLGLPPRAERERMTELQSALLLRRQLAGSWAGGRRGEGGDPPRGSGGEGSGGRALRGRGLRWGKGRRFGGAGGRPAGCV